MTQIENETTDLLRRCLDAFNHLRNQPASSNRRGESTYDIAAAIEDHLRKPAPRLCVIVEGGMIQSIVTDRPGALSGVEAFVIDYDTEGAEESDIIEVPQGGGEPADALGHRESIDAAAIDLAAIAAVIDARDVM